MSQATPFSTRTLRLTIIHSELFIDIFLPLSCYRPVMQTSVPPKSGPAGQSVCTPTIRCHIKLVTPKFSHPG